MEAPVARLLTAWERAVDGLISPEQAVAEASSRTGSSLGPADALALARFGRDLADSAGERWSAALFLQELSMRAAGVADDPGTGLEAALGWLEVAHVITGQIDDLELTLEALRRGEEALSRAQGIGDAPRADRLRLELGTLLLDAVTAGVPLEDYTEHLAQRRPRMAEHGPRVLIERAAQLLEACAGSPHVDAARTRVAWVQSMLFARAAGVDVSVADIAEAIRSGAESLAADDQVARAQLLAFLPAVDERVDPKEADRLFERSLDHVWAREGPIRAATFVLQGVGVIRSAYGPRRALDWLRDARPLLERAGESLRHQGLELELMTLGGLAPSEPRPGSLEDLERSAAGTRERAAKEAWDPRVLSSALLLLSIRSARIDAEDAGLALLDEAESVAPLSSAGHADAYAFNRATLHQGVGVNAVRRQAWQDAARAYGLAMAEFSALGLNRHALGTLAYLRDVSGPTQTAAEASAMLQAIAPQAARLEARLGPAAVDLVQQLCRSTVAGLAASPSVPDELLFATWEVARGLRFAANLATGSHYDPSGDEDAMRLLAGVDDAEREDAASAGDETDEAALDAQREEALLVAYAGEGDSAPGRTPRERLANAQRAFDRHVAEELLRAGDVQASTRLTLTRLRDALDERTALLVFYLGVSPDGWPAVYLLGITREDVTPIVVPHPKFPGFDPAAHVATPATFAPLVGVVREAVRDRPLGRRVLSDEAESLLRELRPALVGEIDAWLADLRRQGKDHLCFAPHGPLHYFPLHLLGGREPFAEDWIVTSLPSLHLLVSGRGGPTLVRRRTPLAAVGVSSGFDPRYAVAPLPRARSEAEAVAALFGASAVVDAGATEAALIGALQSARFVHVATHGQFAVEAPAFQSLILAPSEQSDGRLSAHELLGLDLRGIDLLTLSACETGLGRFDASDNLRGLPASFLLAGVSSIVTTLWPVADDVAECFFVELYTRLRDEVPALDAFAAAQTAAREEFPKHVDWGAFSFVGDWRWS